MPIHTGADGDDDDGADELPGGDYSIGPASNLLWGRDKRREVVRCVLFTAEKIELMLRKMRFTNLRKQNLHKRLKPYMIQVLRSRV